jgi:flagellar biosynthesis repressor protein FlbT
LSRSIHLGLKAGERLYVNGAVLRVDRRVSVELLNEVTFLLEAHVMQAQDTTTPLRQLYFIIQTMLIDPADGGAALVYRQQMTSMQESFETAEILAGLAAIDGLVDGGRLFEALKAVRNLFAAERRILVGLADASSTEPAALRLASP